MRSWLILLVSVACLLAALAVPAAEQKRKAKSDPNAPVRMGYVEPQYVEPQVEPRDGDGYTLSLSGIHQAKAEDQATAEDQAKAADLEMEEDLEIMGEVIRAALAELYTTRGHMILSFGRDLHGLDAALLGAKEVPVERPQGAYVYDHGVVYHVRLDVPPPEEERPKDPAKEADEESPASRSWENAKRSLRGEPPLEPLGLELEWGMPTKTDLVNKLLDTLVENTGNWRRLGPQARITVAITFPRSKPAPAGYGGMGYPGGAAYGGYGSGGYDAGGAGDYDSEEYGGDEGAEGYGGGYGSYGVPGAYPGGARPAAGYPGGGYPGGGYSDYYGAPAGGSGYAAAGYAGSDARSSHEVSGDLHMRQQNYQKAIEAYQKAVEATGYSKLRRDLQRKLIQAYVAAGELEKAQQLIQEILAAAMKSENDHAAPAAPHAIPLPARLTVSVTKLQLDQVAAGKMTREELSQQAAVAYFRPPASVPGVGDREGRPASGGGAYPSRNPGRL